MTWFYKYLPKIIFGIWYWVCESLYICNRGEKKSFCKPLQYGNCDSHEHFHMILCCEEHGWVTAPATIPLDSGSTAMLAPHSWFPEAAPSQWLTMTELLVQAYFYETLFQRMFWVKDCPWAQPKIYQNSAVVFNLSYSILLPFHFLFTGIRLALWSDCFP